MIKHFKVIEIDAEYTIVPATCNGALFIAQYKPYLDYPTRDGAEEAAIAMDRHIERSGEIVPFVEANKKTAPAATGTVQEKNIHGNSLPRGEGEAQV